MTTLKMWTKEEMIQALLDDDKRMLRKWVIEGNNEELNAFLVMVMGYHTLDEYALFDQLDGRGLGTGADGIKGDD